MSFFNFRRTGTTASSNPTSGAQTESVEVVRKRAKHRLIGSAVLVLIGIVVFPLLFDTQPRPVAMDIAIEISGKNSVKPLAAPSAVNAAGTVSAQALEAPAAASTTTPAAPIAQNSVPAAEKLTPSSGLSPTEEIITEPKPASVAKADRPDVPAKPSPTVEPTVGETRTASQISEAARARALLEGRAVPAAVASPPSAAPSESRLIVQVGAFADAAKAREIRSKLEKAGLKTYTQLIETPAGSRTRVRVGPFTNRADAEKAAGKIKTLDLPAAILTL